MINIELFKEVIDEMYAIIDKLESEKIDLEIDNNFLKDSLKNKEDKLYEYVDKDTL